VANEISQLLADLKQDHRHLGEELARLVDEFRFDLIVALSKQEKGAQQ
jgi:hypothetical protein